MPRAHALLLEKIHTSAEEDLGRHGIAVHRVDHGLTQDELIAELHKLSTVTPLIVGLRSKTHVRAKTFQAVPNLVAIGAFCIGTDQIDLQAARSNGVAVFNAPFSSTRSVAELVIAEIVMLSRQIFPRNRAAHKGRWAKSAAGSHEVRGKTLGIVGYGHIGSQVSVLAEALGLRVLFYDIDKRLPLGNAQPCATLGELLGNSDYVTLHVPDTEQTRDMMGHEELAMMRPHAYLLNASRGAVVDLKALREALESGHISGAAVDVFPQEPAGESDPFVCALQGLDNVILTPHIGGSTLEAQQNIGHEVAGAVARFLDVGTTIGCVTLPQLDAPRPSFPAHIRASRLINIHRNVPGVLSRINRVIAESEINIAGQSLATLDEVGLAIVDMPVAPDDPRAQALCDAIAQLDTSLRSRMLELVM